MDERYLPLVVEEAAEVIQAITKIQRFGLDRVYPEGAHANETNTEALESEIGDLLEVISRLDLSAKVVWKGRLKKCAQLKKWGPDRSDSELDANLVEFQDDNST